MASKKSKVLAIAFCAAVMSGIYINPVLAYHGQEDFNYQHNTTESGLNNPEIHHTVDEGKFRPDWEPVHPEGDVNCEEEVANSNITVGDMNKVTADLVENDEKINSKVDKVASDVKDLQEQVNNIETTTDTDTHVKEGAATVDDNGNVTMDIVDKNGKDTGKNVTISGLASDSELEGVKNELQQQIDNIDVEDTNTQINEGTYTAEADGTVNMDVVDKVTGEVTENAVTIEGLASDNELEGVKNELQQQIDSIDVEDTDTYIETGEHFADENGDITMDIVDKDGDPTGETVIIKDVASKSDMEVADAGLASAIKNETLDREAADNEIKADLAQETNDREVADKIESTLREWGDEQLQENIEAEAEKREQADNQIKNDLKQETVDRIAGDNALNNAINKETVEREAADTLIREDLAQETADREKADADLQDKIGQEEMNRVNEDAAIRGEISKEHADRVAADQELEDKIGQEEMNRVNEDAAIRGEISKEHADRVAADADHQEQLDDHSQQLDAVRGEISEEHRVNGEQNETLADHQEQLDDHSQQLDAVRGEISSEIRDRTEADKQLQQSIDIQREVIGAGSTEELKGAYSGTNYISDAENMVEADRKLDAAISDVNSRVDGIESRVDGLEGRIDKVGAMSAAIANLRTMGYDPAAPTEVAVGVGQYRDETGMALGLFHYPNRDFMLSLSVSTSGDEYMGGIGATWKFGRKSPEKVAEIKKAQAEADARRAEEQKLAKAEEMKKAAKEAKVQAQMERHAKLAAERAALEEA